jgi:hypothetical protein
MGQVGSALTTPTVKRTAGFAGTGCRPSPKATSYWVHVYVIGDV